MKKGNQKIKQGILLAFGEIFLKSAGVQRGLRNKLIKNISFLLNKGEIDFKIHSWRERIFIEGKNWRKISSVLKNIFGLVWLARVFFLEKATLKELENFVKENYQKWIKKQETFALRIKKDSSIKESRQKIIETIARHINRKVDLTRPKKEIFIEGRKNSWFVYFKKQKGAGGLPVSSQGKVLSLISGEIDSPVAAYLMNKRGAENIWLHFHSFPLVSQKSIEKIKELAQVFLKYQPKIKVYFVPFAKIQTEIKTKIPAKYRVLLYRRIMFKIAQKISQKEKCLALATGENLGQVSSQTLTNLQITNKGIKIPIFRPLISWDKQEIISLAKKINTYEISIRPQEDCCTLFVPKHQTAEGKIEQIKELEKKLNLTKLISSSIKESEVKIF